jgi:hypothetical protein
MLVFARVREVGCSPGSGIRSAAERRVVIAFPCVSRAGSPLSTIPPVLLLLFIAGCARAGGAAAPPKSPPQSGERADEKGRQTMLVVRNQKAVGVTPGTLIDLVVTRPVAIPHEHRFEWPVSPAIEGDAVRFLRLRIEPPPPDVDGGVTTHHYELEAVKPGTARVTLEPRPASVDSAHPPVVLDVTVADAGTSANPNTSRTLPELIRHLVEVIATSPDSTLEIAKGFGEVETDAGGPIYVKPSDPRLKRVIVARNPRIGGTNHVELQLAVPGSVTVAEIEALWGPAQHPPPLSLETRSVIFRPPLPEGARFLPTVTMTLDGDENGPAIWVAVIRDPLPPGSRTP